MAYKVSRKGDHFFSFFHDLPLYLPLKNPQTLNSTLASIVLPASFQLLKLQTQ